MPADQVRSAQLALAAELRAARERTGHTLRELQAATFASDSALSRYLSGRSVPPWDVVAALCRQLGSDPERLRPLWQEAKTARRRRQDPAVETRESLVNRISTITADVATAIRALQARGEAVPEALPAAAALLRDAQRLISQS